MSVELKKLKHLSGSKGAGQATGPMKVSTPWYQREIHLFGQGLSMKKKEAFFLELGILLKAGLDFKTSLELVTEGVPLKDREKIFEPMKTAIFKGSSMSEAMSASGKFSEYDIFSIRIAEESGGMHQVLQALADFYHKTLQHRRILTSALSYPAVVILTALGALAFLLNFLVPMFGDVYRRLHQDLPSVTQAVVRLSELFGRYGGRVSLLIASAIFILYTQRKKIWFRRVSAWIVLRIPVIGPLIGMLYLNRFCGAMGFLTGSRVPVLKALELTRQMVQFYPLSAAAERMCTGILRGQTLHDSMLAHVPLFPKRMIALVKVGEEVNKLDQMFERLAAQYHDEAEQRIKSLGSLIEPLLIVFLALVVGTVLVAMYLPIFKLVSNFNG